jgi:signal transduction histidine kinase/CheY-like chemotaxis protein
VKASLIRSWTRFAQVAAGLVAVSGGVALYGWIADAEPPKAMIIGGIAIKANTTICLILAGLSLIVLTRIERYSRGAILAARIAAAIVAAVGGITVLEHLTGWNPGIDTLLFNEPAGLPATTSPGRMGPPASISLFLLGIALLLIDAWPARRSLPAQILALIVALIALLSLIGYAYGIQRLYQVSGVTGIAAHTAIAIELLAIALLAARPSHGLMRILVLDDAGGEMARRVLLPAIVLPFVLGWIRTISQRAGWIDDSVGRPLLILSLIVSFTTLVWFSARALSIIGRDRTRVAEHREQLLVSERAAREEAERSVRLKDEFLATVSHELRTPLNAILGYAQLMRQGVLDPDTAGGLEVIERNARSQKQIIEDILDMSRIVTGKLLLEVRQIDLGAVIQSAIATVRPSADAKGIRIVQVLDPNAGPIRGDATRLQQVIWNLVSNAIKFTPKGGKVQIALERTHSGVRLIVSDSGEGIRPDFLGQVFEKFRQADASTTRRHGGLGLGLSIVKSVVELHGGTVRAESGGIGKGATFIVELPLTAVAAPPERPENSAADNGESEPARPPSASEQELPSLSGLTVLAVDDENDALTMLRRSLERHGARVVTAKSAAEATDLMDVITVDVIVSDIGMPEVDGYEFVRRVRSRDARHGGAVPAAALTAVARSEDRIRALDAGYQMHITKPVDPAELVLAVASLTGRNIEQSRDT